MTSRVLAVLAMVLILPFAGAGAESTGTATAKDLAGVWKLDRDASDAVAPMLERMDAPWIARRMADSMSPTMTVTPLADGRLHIRNENPIRTTEQELPLDGVAREARDAMGRKVVRTASWDDGHLVVTSRNYVEADRIVSVESTWTRSGDTLVIVNRIDPDGDVLVIRRVFQREPEGDR